MDYFLFKVKKSLRTNGRYLIFILILLAGRIGYTQIQFTEGYFIDNNGQRTDCLIKNVDWYNNPVKFEYKSSENDESKLLYISNIKEFSVPNESKFVRFKVQIDRTENRINRLGTEGRPVFREEELFLRVLVEGQASLYSYRDGNLTLFFFKTETSDIQQLIFKKYRDEEEFYTIRTNNQYRQQLWNDLKCPDISEKRVRHLKYGKSNLMAFFVDYNQCVRSEIIWQEGKKRPSFHLTLRPGIKSASVFVSSSSRPRRNANFDNEFGFRMGMEAELVFSFNKGKWALLAEPTYQYYKPELEMNHISTLIENTIVDIDYSSIEFPIGVRHYFFLNDHSRVFVNVLYVIDIGIGSNKITYTDNFGSFQSTPYILDIDTGANFAFGLGYKYTNYSLELRYGFKRDLLTNYDNWSADHKNLSLVLGYTLF